MSIPKTDTPKPTPRRSRRGQGTADTLSTRWNQAEKNLIAAAAGGTWSTTAVLELAHAAPATQPEHMPKLPGSPRPFKTSVRVNSDDNQLLVERALPGEIPSNTLHRLALWGAAARLGPDWRPNVQRTEEAIKRISAAVVSFTDTAGAALEEMLRFQAAADALSAQLAEAEARTATKRLSALIEAVAQGDPDPAASVSRSISHTKLPESV